MFETRKPLTGNEAVIDSLGRRYDDCEACGATPNQDHARTCLATINGRAMAAEQQQDGA